MNKEKEKQTEEEKKKKHEEYQEKLTTIERVYFDKYVSLANGVIAGEWGNGQARKRALNSSGYDYNLVQDIVDLKIKYGE